MRNEPDCRGRKVNIIGHLHSLGKYKPTSPNYANIVTSSCTCSYDTLRHPPYRNIVPPPYPGNTIIPVVCGDSMNSDASRKTISLTSSRDGEKRTDPPPWAKGIRDVVSRLFRFGSTVKSTCSVRFPVGHPERPGNTLILE